MPHLNEPIENSNLIENSKIKKENGVGYNSDFLWLALYCGGLAFSLYKNQEREKATRDIEESISLHFFSPLNSSLITC